jgi:hypothetical protein
VNLINANVPIVDYEKKKFTQKSSKNYEIYLLIYLNSLLGKKVFSDKQNYKMTIKTNNLTKHFNDNENILKSVYLKNEYSKTINTSNNTHSKYPQKQSISNSSKFEGTKTPRENNSTKFLHSPYSNMSIFHNVPSTNERITKNYNDFINTKSSLEYKNSSKNLFLKPLPKIQTINRDRKSSK